MLPSRIVAVAGVATSRRFVRAVVVVFGCLVFVEVQPLWPWTTVSLNTGDDRLISEQRRLMFDTSEVAQRMMHRFPQFLPLVSIVCPFLTLLLFAGLLSWFFCRSKTEPQGTVSSLSSADVEAWELFRELDEADHGSVSLEQLRAFVQARTQSAADGGKQCKELLVRLDENAPLVATALNPTQFLLRARSWRQEGLDVVHDVANEKLAMRYPSGLQSLCNCTFGRVRRKMLAQDFLRATRDNKEEELRKTALAVFFDSVSEALSIVDLCTDLLLLRQLLREAVSCMDDKTKMGCADHDFQILVLAMCVTIVSPYLVAYSSGVHLLLSHGVFDPAPASWGSCVRKMVSVLYLTWLGPLYFLMLDVLIALQAFLWEPLALLLTDHCYRAGERCVDAVYEALGMNRMAVKGYKTQRVIAQLLFESLVQLTLQTLVYTKVIDSGDLMETASTQLFVSIISSCVNTVLQFGKIWVESHGLKEGFVRYSMICMQAKVGWVPFLDVLVPLDTGAAGHEREVLDFGMIRCEMGWITAWTGVRMDVSYEFTDQSVETVLNRMALRPVQDETEKPLRSCRLGNSCQNTTAVRVLQLISACRGRVDVNFSGINWKKVVENMDAAGQLRRTTDGRWEAWLPDGTPLLMQCLLSEAPAKDPDNGDEREEVEEVVEPTDLGGKDFYLGHVARTLLLQETHGGAYPDTANVSQETSLLVLCARGKMARGAALLLHNRANPNIKVRGRTPLCEAIQKNDLATVRLLLSVKDIDVQLSGASNGVQDKKVSPLGQAMRNLSCNASLQTVGMFWRARRILNMILDRSPDLPSVEIPFFFEALLAMSKMSETSGAHVEELVQKCVGPATLLEWKDAEKSTLLHFAAKYAKGFNPFHGRQFEKLWIWLGKFTAQERLEYARSTNDRGDTPLTILSRQKIGFEDDGAKGRGLTDWLWAEVRPERGSDEYKALVEGFSLMCYNCHMRKPELTYMKALVGPDLNPLDMAVEKQHEAALLELVKTWEIDEHELNARKTKIQSAQGAILGPDELDVGEGSDEGTPDTEVWAEKQEELEEKQVAVYSGRLAAAQLSASLVANPEARVQVIVDILTCMLEIVSAMDLVTDIVIFWAMLQHFHVYWSTITLLSMVAPYLVAYAAGMKLLLRNRVFDKVDLNGNENARPRLRAVVGLASISPLCILYFFLIDVIYALKALIVDALMLILQVLTLGSCRPETGDFVDDFCSRILLLSRMDIEGFRRLRTVSQLIFEVLVQLPLQCRIVTMPHFAAQMGLDSWQLMLSMFFALFHSVVSGCLTWAEARSCRTTLLHYLALCMSGRTNWVPFAEQFTRTQTEERSSEGAAGSDTDTQEYNFGALEIQVGCLGKFRVRYEFSRETARVLIESLSHLDPQEIKQRRPVVVLGNTLSRVGLQDILPMHRSLASRVRLEMGSDVDWKRVLENSTLEWETPDRLQPRGDTTHDFLLRFLSFENVEVVRALLEHSAEPFGLGVSGHLLLTEAVMQKNSALCELLLDNRCPLIPDEDMRRVEVRTTEADASLTTNIKLPLATALLVGDVDVIDTFLSHPRTRLTAMLRGQLQRKALQEFEQSSREMDVLEQSRHSRNAQIYVFLSGGLRATSFPDCVHGGRDFEILARSEQNEAAVVWLDAMAVERPLNQRVKLIFRERSLDVTATDLERFVLLRSMLSTRGTRWPVGHADHVRDPARGVVLGPARPGDPVDMSGLQKFYPALKADVFQHLLHLCATGQHDPLHRVHTALVPPMDVLCDGLGLDRGIGAYVRATADVRVARTAEFKQQTALIVRASDATRAKTIMSFTLPDECWRVLDLDITGLWKDQGWGGTGANRIRLSAATEHAGVINSDVWSIDHNRDGYKKTPTNVALQWSGRIGHDVERNTDARSFMEVLSAGDVVELILTCVPWGGWTASAEETTVSMKYLTNSLATGAT